MAAVSEQHLANLTKETLTKMYTDQGFDLFNDSQRYKESEALRSD